MSTMIVKIKSYSSENEFIEGGTGIFLPPNHIFTAAHVLCGDRHTAVLQEKEMDVVVEKENNVAALLSIEPVVRMEESSEPLLFTVEEILDHDTAWSAEGYITDEQILHQMSGQGLAASVYSMGTVDFKLLNIENGYAENYHGMSGAPVLCRGRIVGMLQQQNMSERGLLNLEMSSTTLLEELLPSKFLVPSKYREEFEKRARQITQELIDHNKKNKKYIPEIFVEEGEYKENFRYFSEPNLFINKVIEEITALDFRAVNKFILQNDEKGGELDFKDIESFTATHTWMETAELLIQRLDAAIKEINRVRNLISVRDKGISLERYYRQEDGSSCFIRYTLEDLRDEIRFFKYKVVLITRGAGQGKTNFLCDFCENFLLKKQLPVLFYNAYDIREPIFNLIQKELTLDEKYSWEYVSRVLTQNWRNTYRSITIVIDGLNENTALNDFGGYVSDFLRQVMKLPFLKVILSTRNELLKERFGQLTPEVLGGDFYLMDMQRQSERFAERIFWGYLRYFEITIEQNSLTQKTYNMLTRDTLLLRFFCEVNNGKKQVWMKHIYKYSLFEKYYGMKKEAAALCRSSLEEELFDKLLNHLCQLMIDNQQFSTVPRSALTDEELKIFDRLLETDVLFKQESQVVEGYLSKTEIVVGFTFDEFRDFCITRYILSNRSEIFSDLWKKIHSENWSVLEGVERYTFFLAKTKAPGILPVLQTKPEYPRLYWENVWELEDTDVAAEDIQMWKQEVLENGSYADSVVEFLLQRRDRGYFKTVNIEQLFDILDELACDLGMFDAVTQRVFGKTKGGSYGRNLMRQGSVWPCDKLIDGFQKMKQHTELVKKDKDFLRLSVYMMQLDAYQIRKLWSDIYENAPETVIEILKIYAAKENLPRLISYNLASILEVLLKNNAGDTELEKLSAMLTEKNRQYDYNAISASLADIWGL